MHVLTATGADGTTTRVLVKIEGPWERMAANGTLGETEDPLHEWRFEVQALDANGAPQWDATLFAELVEDAPRRLRFKNLSHGGEAKLGRRGVPDALYEAVACGDLLGLGAVVLVSSERGGDPDTGDYLSAKGGKVWKRLEDQGRARYEDAEKRWYYVCPTRRGA